MGRWDKLLAPAPAGSRPERPAPRYYSAFGAAGRSSAPAPAASPAQPPGVRSAAWALCPVAIPADGSGPQRQGPPPAPAGAVPDAGDSKHGFQRRRERDLAMPSASELQRTSGASSSRPEDRPAEQRRFRGSVRVDERGEERGCAGDDHQGAAAFSRQAGRPVTPKEGELQSERLDGRQSQRWRRKTKEEGSSREAIADEVFNAFNEPAAATPLFQDGAARTRTAAEPHTARAAVTGRPVLPPADVDPRSPSSSDPTHKATSLPLAKVALDQSVSPSTSGHFGGETEVRARAETGGEQTARYRILLAIALIRQRHVLQQRPMRACLPLWRELWGSQRGRNRRTATPQPVLRLKRPPPATAAQSRPHPLQIRAVPRAPRRRTTRLNARGAAKSARPRRCPPTRVTRKRTGRRPTLRQTTKTTRQETTTVASKCL